MPRIERAPQRSTFALLDQIVTVLGGTKLSFWPFLSGIGTTTFPYGSGNDGILLTASSAIESILDPSQHVGGVHSLANDGTTSYLSAPPHRPLLPLGRLRFPPFFPGGECFVGGGGPAPRGPPWQRSERKEMWGLAG